MNIAPFKVRLETEKKKLESDLSGVALQVTPGEWEPIAPVSDVSADPSDIATKAEGYDDNAGITADLQARLESVTAALGRIDAGTYGVCEVGGDPIEKARLEADPAARTCIKHLK